MRLTQGSPDAGRSQGDASLLLGRGGYITEVNHQTVIWPRTRIKTNGLSRKEEQKGIDSSYLMRSILIMNRDAIDQYSLPYHRGSCPISVCDTLECLLIAEADIFESL